VEEHGNLSNHVEIAKFLTEYYGRPVTAQDVQSLLRGLASNPQLREIFEDLRR
jgi:hypothetical protein